MRPLKLFTKNQFSHLPTIPIILHPFDPRKKLIAKEYIKYINTALAEYHVSAKIFGSTAYEITGKEEIEVGIYLNNQNWKEVINRIDNMGKTKDVLERDFAQYNDMFQGFKIDLLLMKGHTALVNKRIHDFFLKHPDVVKKYEAVKKKFSYSKQEYVLKKNEFINEIIEELPDEDYYVEKYDKDFDI